MDTQVAEHAQAIPKAAGYRTTLYFGAFASVFTAIYLLSWPTLFSFDLWALKDRGSFLNLDYLLQQHLRLGVDTFYSYGLLPVLVQHWLFEWFGPGYWPLIGCAALTLLLIASFCALLLRFLPRTTTWLLALMCMARLLNVVNPNLPYSFVQISILFALLLVLARRFDLALAAAAIGCWSVPSLPLLLFASLVIVVVAEWILQPEHRLQTLALALLPGSVTYVAIGLLLAFEFGWKSVMATATPLAGMSYYRKTGYGSSHALMEFLHPSGFDTRHYLLHAFLNPVAWWLFSSILLFCLTLSACWNVASLRRLEPRCMAIILCAVIQFSLAFAAYGAPHQHYLYDPILIVGVLLGLASIRKPLLQKSLLIIFLSLGILAQATIARATLREWKQVRSTDTANLYADPAWVSEFKPILRLAEKENVLMLSYSTGIHHYFPAVQSPEMWFILHGQFFPADVTRVNNQIGNADVVVLDMTSPIDFDFLKPGSLIASSFCMTSTTQNFQVWWRRTRLPAGVTCATAQQPNSAVSAPDVRFSNVR